MGLSRMATDARFSESRHFTHYCAEVLFIKQVLRRANKWREYFTCPHTQGEVGCQLFPLCQPGRMFFCELN